MQLSTQPGDFDYSRSNADIFFIYPHRTHSVDSIPPSYRPDNFRPVTQNTDNQNVITRDPREDINSPPPSYSQVISQK
jgi:hypothetical protein